MPKLAIVAALERELSGLIKNWSRISREHQGRKFIFFEHDDAVAVCGGIGVNAARRAAEAIIALYHPTLIQSVGFAGALDSSLHVGDVFTPSVITDARDGSRIQSDASQLTSEDGALVTFMAMAGVDQKTKLAQSYAARAVDMEAAAVGTAARAHGISFAAVKVISDEMDFEIPGADRFIAPNGQFNTAKFILFAALRPWLWMRVATLTRNSSKAAKSLAAHLEQSSVRLCSSDREISDRSAPALIEPVAATHRSPSEGHE